MREVRRNLRDATRALSRSRFHSLVIVLALGLAIGITSLFASVLNSVVLKPLPYVNAEELVSLSQADGGAVSGRVFHFVREHSNTLAFTAAHSQPTGWNARLGQQVEYLKGFRISTGYFETLGVRPLLGREFRSDDDRSGAPRVVLLSEGVWRRLLQSDPAVLGRPIELGGATYEIVGVLPEVTTFPEAQVWTPLVIPPTNNSWSFGVVGRLRPGHTVSDAQAEYSSLTQRFPWAADDTSSAEGTFVWQSYRELLTGRLWTPLMLLLAASLGLVLMASTNVVTFSVVRSADRRTEFATKLALGATRTEIGQSLAIEALLLGTLTTLLAVTTLWAGLRASQVIVPPQLLAGRSVTTEGWPVLILSLGPFILCSLIYFLPSLVGLRSLDHSMVIANFARHTHGRRVVVLRRILVACQFAVASVLLITSALFLRTFANLSRVDLGFSADDVWVTEVSLQGALPSAANETIAMFDQVLQRAENLPGLETVSVSTGIPIQRGINLPLARISGSPVNQVKPVDWRYVSTGYFDLFEIALLGGRLFTEQDNSAGSKVTVISESFARQFFPGQNPIGERIGLVGGMLGESQREIIGIVRDVKAMSGASKSTGSNAIVSDAPAMVYAPMSQITNGVASMHASSPIAWSFKSKSLDSRLINEFEQIVRSELHGTSVIRSRAMDAVVSAEIAPDRFRMALVSVFAAVSTVLAALGLYGLLSYLVRIRHKEIGIRLTVGADPASIASRFLRDAAVDTAAGLLLGAIAALAVSNLVRSLLWGVAPVDLLSYCSAIVTLSIVGVMASAVPVWRASRIDPASTLRE